MNKYLFLLAWIQGSDMAAGEETKVHNQEDLLPQFEDGNEHIFALAMFNCPNDEVATIIGRSEAFDNGFTAHNSLSTVIEIDKDHEAFDLCKTIDVQEYLNLKP